MTELANMIRDNKTKDSLTEIYDVERQQDMQTYNDEDDDDHDNYSYDEDYIIVS